MLIEVYLVQIRITALAADFLQMSIFLWITSSSVLSDWRWGLCLFVKLWWVGAHHSNWLLWPDSITINVVDQWIIWWHGARPNCLIWWDLVRWNLGYSRDLIFRRWTHRFWLRLNNSYWYVFLLFFLVKLLFLGVWGILGRRHILWSFLQVVYCVTLLIWLLTLIINCTFFLFIKIVWNFNESFLYRLLEVLFW